MTYGQIKLRLTQAFPAVSIDLIEGWINDRYQEILGELPWTRLNVQTTITTVIGKSIYVVPANCGILRDDALTNSYGTMRRFSNSQINDGDPTRAQTGEPFAWASMMDDNSFPPNMQVELYPVPDAVYTLPLEYVAEAVPLNTTGTILMVWIQPSALIEGATAKIKAHLKDYTGATFHTTEAEKALKKMRRTDANNMAPAQMAIDPYFTAHRRNRRGRWSNTTSNYQSNLMQTVNVPTFIDNEIPVGVIDSVNATFTLANAPNPPTSLELTRNGLEDSFGIDYTLTGKTIQFAAGAVPQSGPPPDILRARYRC